MYQHNAANQLVTAVDAASGVASYTYDGNGNLVYAQKRVRFGFFGEGWTYIQPAQLAHQCEPGAGRPRAAGGGVCV